MLAGRDGYTTDAEHQWRQRWHIHVVGVSPHCPCARTGASAMLRASNKYPLRIAGRHGCLHFGGGKAKKTY